MNSKCQVEIGRRISNGKIQSADFKAFRFLSLPVAYQRVYNLQFRVCPDRESCLLIAGRGIWVFAYQLVSRLVFPQAV